jgi:hypothetical protein
MIKYVPCPHCGSMNREIDTKCYSCEATLAGRPADAMGGAPSPGADNSAPIPPDPGTRVPGSTKFSPEKQNRDSTIIHGLRSGAIAGAIVGTFCGLTCSLFGGMIGGAISSSLGGQLASAGLVAVIVFLAIFISQVIFATIIGAILGGMNVLCYQTDCIKFGAIAGIIVGVVFWLLGRGGSVGFFGNATNGAIIGWLACYVERSWFRKQYAEL